MLKLRNHIATQRKINYVIHDKLQAKPTKPLKIKLNQAQISLKKLFLKPKTHLAFLPHQGQFDRDILIEFNFMLCRENFCPL